MDTTRNQLGLALQTFAEHPDQWRLLGERPELSRPAVAEVMRVNPTVTWITREASEDLDFQGLSNRRRDDPAPAHRIGGQRPAPVPRAGL